MKIEFKVEFWPIITFITQSIRIDPSKFELSSFVISTHITSSNLIYSIQLSPLELR